MSEYQDNGGIGPWHVGEIKVQEQVMGPVDAAQVRAQYNDFISDTIRDNYKDFFEDASWLVVASQDADGHPRASIMQAPISSLPQGAGASLDPLPADKGLVSIPQDGQTFELNANGIIRGDPLEKNLQRPNAQVGMLRIELDRRQRARLNGVVVDQNNTSDAKIKARVRQSYGNCPKYIQARTWKPNPVQHGNRGRQVQLLQYDEELVALHDMIRHADTFFIVSGGEDNGLDASHRGGPPGFVKPVGPRTLVYPEYVGNFFFNTLGNIALDPRVGLLFVNFANGDIVQIKASAKIDFNKDSSMPGSQRVIHLEIASALLMKSALRMVSTDDPIPSPFNPPAATRSGDPVRITQIMPQTEDTSTFYLALSRPINYEPGQYGNFLIENGEDSFNRAWTISSTPRQGSSSAGGDTRIAITVKHKKGGKVSGLLHDMQELRKLKLRLLGIEGNFCVRHPWRSSADDVVEAHSEGVCASDDGQDKEGIYVFAAAGSGVTPVISNLRRMAMTGQTAIVFLSAKNAADVIFSRELQALVSSRIRIVINLTRVEDQVSLPESKEGKLYYFNGRVSPEAIRQGLQGYEDAKIEALFACGTDPFVAHFQSAWSSAQAPKPHNVVTESFMY